MRALFSVALALGLHLAPAAWGQTGAAAPPPALVPASLAIAQQQPSRERQAGSAQSPAPLQPTQQAAQTQDSGGEPSAAMLLAALALMLAIALRRWGAAQQ